MSHEVHLHPHPPIGWALVFAGSLLAQVSPAGGFGVAGLIASISGLLLAGVQYYKIFMDAKQRDARIEEQNAQILRLKGQILDATQKRHDLRADFFAQYLKLQEKIAERDIRIARLEGQLGIVDRSHVDAINAISRDNTVIAGSLNPPVPVSPIRLEPLSGSDDEISPIRP